MDPELRAALEACGFVVVGRTTYQGKVEEYNLFNQAGTRIDINYRNSSEVFRYSETPEGEL